MDAKSEACTISEEHQVSIHSSLLPPPPSSSSINARLPVELIQAIILDVENPSDLLSLALTDRALHNLIIPNQIDFRFIQCTPLRKKLWTFFAENPLYSSRVREIKLIDETHAEGRACPIIPKQFRQDRPEQQTRRRMGEDEISYPDISQLIFSLHKMVNLLKFSWDPAVVALNEFTRLQIGEAIRVSGCNLSGLSGHIDEMDIRALNLSLPHNIIKEPLWDIPGQFISQLTLIIEDGRNLPPQETVQTLSDILLVSYPALTELALYLDYYKYDHVEVFEFPLLQKASWPNLRKLTLALEVSLYPPPYGDDPLAPPQIGEKIQIMANFLARHIKLECLKFGGYDSLFPNAGCLTTQNVPRLRSLSVTSPPTLPLTLPSILPVKVGSQIHHLGFTITEECLVFLDNLPNLRSCQVSLKSKLLERFLQRVPSVEKLHLTHDDMDWSENTPERRTNIRKASLKERALPSLRNLTHLGGPLFWATNSFKYVKFLDVADGTFLDALSTRTSVQYVEINPWNEIWAEIKRDTNGKYTGYRAFPERHISVDLWGEFAVLSKDVFQFQ